MSPSKQERIFDISYSTELLLIGKADLDTAIALQNIPNIRIENVFYHLQQSIEKFLKCVLVHLCVPVPLVHDLGILAAKIPKSFEPPYGYELQQLTEFATIRRYEQGEFVLTAEELNETILIANKMLDWATSCLEKKI